MVSWICSTNIVLLVILGIMLPRKVFAANDIDPNRPMVALTFDDGPCPKYTSQILNVLEANNARATFFVLGTQAAEYPYLLSRMRASGQEIGNHSLNHPDLRTLTTGEVLYQLSLTDDFVQSATGSPPTLVRPPYGFINEDIINLIDRPIIFWSLDTLDWQTIDVNDAANTAELVLSTIQDGDVVLMHDIFDSTARATEIIVPELIARGYQLVTVSDLIRYRGYAVQPGNVYNSFYPQ